MATAREMRVQDRQESTMTDRVDPGPRARGTRGSSGWGSRLLVRDEREYEGRNGLAVRVLLCEPVKEDSRVLPRFLRAGSQCGPQAEGSLGRA